MRVQVLSSITEVDTAAWNQLTAAASPFVQHEFLTALETSGSVAPATGWTPQHLAVFDDTNVLHAALPLYRKTHGFGDFVFDWTWAQAYDNAGGSYYPKLVASIPFSPITGPRLLCAPGADRAALAALLLGRAREQVQRDQLSSLHVYFPHADDLALLEANGLMPRTGYQFHWHNPGYRDFEDFLSTFSADKRKKVKRERRYVHEAGVSTEVRSGRELTSAEWDVYYHFFCTTQMNYGAPIFLTREFFYTLGAILPDQALVIFARRGADYVGASLYLRGHDALYGRWWGGESGIHSLHFEVCYYSAIDYCIRERLSRFEAGAQGEHKLARGFVPTPTYSAHWLADTRFGRAVADYLARERRGVDHEIDELSEHAPYRQPAEETTR